MTDVSALVEKYGKPSTVEKYNKNHDKMGRFSSGGGGGGAKKSGSVSAKDDHMPGGRIRDPKTGKVVRVTEKQGAEVKALSPGGRRQYRHTRGTYGTDHKTAMREVKAKGAKADAPKPSTGPKKRRATAASVAATPKQKADVKTLSTQGRKTYTSARIRGKLTHAQAMSAARKVK